jgi:hypothetical protein
MEYVQPEPNAVKTVGILQLVFGIISLLCGLLALAGGASSLGQKGGGGPGQVDEAEIERRFEAEIPFYKAAQYAEMGVGVLLSVLMVASGAGLLNRQPWGRSLAIVYAILSICYHAVDLVYGLAFVLPVMNTVFDAVAAKAGASGAAGFMKAFAMVIMFVGAAFTLYPIIILVIMLRPGVKAALAGGEPLGGPPDYDDRARGPIGDVPPDDRYRQPPDDRLTT